MKKDTKSIVADESLISPVYKYIHEKFVSLRSLNFKYLPAYANFLLQYKLRNFSVEQLKLSREFKLPLLQFLHHLPDEKLIELGETTNREFLQYVSGNNVENYIKLSLDRWLNNQLPILTKNQINADDITLLSFIRRQVFRTFISDYTSDLQHALNILNEVDIYTATSDSMALKTLLNIQNRKFVEAQALAKIGNWQWDLQTQKLSWSDEIYKIYEIETQSPISPEMIAAYNHADDAELVQKSMQHLTETLLPHDFFYRIILKSGKEKILHAKGEVKLDDSGKVAEAFGTLQDVTEQKQKEKQLERSRSFIEKVTNFSPCIISVFNINNFNYVFVNKRIGSILGYTAEDFYAKGRKFFYELVHEEDISIIRKNIDELVNEANSSRETTTERIRDFKYRMKHANGKFKWIHTFTTVFNRDVNNHVETLLNISIDVTESHLLTLKLAAANEEIRQTEIRYQRMISEIEDYAILSLDRDGFIQNWNKGAEKIKGYSANEIIGKNFRIFYRKEDQEMKLPESLINEAVKNGKSSHEGWRVKKDGTFFWGSVVITALHDDENNVIGFSKVTRNLTDKKIADDKLKDYAARIEKHNEELLRINKDLDSFTYTASHDLQEPLRKIKTFCNLILNKENEKFSADVQNYFNRIESAAERMQALIDSLLVYSRASATALILSPTDLNDVIRETQKELSHIIHETNATINAQNLIVVNAMPLQMQQLFSNIIGNAIKYKRSDVAPVVNISGAFIEQVHNSQPKPFYKIDISDNGIGFDQEHAEIIFQLFQRLHGRTEYSGTGIGLAICKKIVEHHKGSITATSEPGKGATFTILLPL